MRKMFLLLLILILFSAIVYLGYSILQKKKQRELIHSQISQIPGFTLKDIDGNSHQLKKLAESKSTLLVYFNSTCEVCQLELGAISRQIKEFKGHNLIFVTVESPEEIKGFITDLRLGSIDNVHFLIDSEMEVARYYGVTSIPALFLYDSESDHLDNYTGFVKVDLIIEKLDIGKGTTP